MKLLLTYADFSKKKEDEIQEIIIPFNKAISYSPIVLEKLSTRLYTDVLLRKLINEGLIKQNQIEYANEEGTSFIIFTIENVEFLETVIENNFVNKRKEWDSNKKERYQTFLSEFSEFCMFKLKEKESA